MEIKIYAPVDCIVKPINECSDKVFSSKSLGDGIFIIPKKEDFYSPLSQGKIDFIFDTKHAVFFDQDNVKILMHIGLDTVKLNGKPFNYFVKNGDVINKETKIVKVDLNYVKNKNILLETPIVVAFENNINNIKVEVLKNFAKKGDLIANIVFEKVNLIENKITNGILSIKSYKSKYLNAADEFIKHVGGLENFIEVYNCMTRLRFIIIDKLIVDKNKILKNELVKGINWNGNELQIIIGGECYKVKDEIIKIKNGEIVENQLDKKSIKKPPLSKRALTMLSGIMAPNIPILMAVGLIAALQSILVTAGVTKEVTDSSINNTDLFSGILYILSKVGLNLIGVAFCYTTCKYLKGNPIMALIIGLTLTSRFLYGVMPSDNLDPKFGDWIGNGWLLFKVGNYDVMVKSYEGSVLPFIAAGVLCVLSDKWVKTWMPASVDIVFRPLLVYLFALIPIFLILGPTLAFVEYGLSLIVSFIESWPIGLGVAIFAFSWQILVLTGVHVAVVMAIMIPTIMATPVVPTLMISAVYLGAFGQVGAGIGVAIITKNKQIKVISIGALTAGICGITEPMIYGVNLPKLRPFIAGCLGAAVAGFISGILNIQFVRSSGMGIFSITGVDGLKNQALYVLTWIVSVGLSALFTILIYKEKNDEYKHTKYIFKKFNYKALSLIFNKKQKNLLKTEFLDIENEFLKTIKNNKKIFKEYFKYSTKLIKLEQNLIIINNKEEKKSKKLYYKATKMLNKKNKSIDLVNNIIKEYNNFTLESFKKIVLEKISILKNENKDLLLSFTKITETLFLDSKRILKELSKKVGFEPLFVYENGIFNALNATDISFGYIDQKYISFSKEEKYNYKEYKKTQKLKNNNFI